MKRTLSKLLTPVTSPIAYSKKLHFCPDVFEFSVPGRAMLVDQYSILYIANHLLTFSCPRFLFSLETNSWAGKIATATYGFYLKVCSPTCTKDRMCELFETASFQSDVGWICTSHTFCYHTHCLSGTRFVSDLCHQHSSQSGHGDVMCALLGLFFWFEG